MNSSREILLRPTIAMNTGESKLAQCAHCGCLAVWSVSDGRKLSNCPACDRTEWTGQTFDVGPFVVGFSDADRRIANQILEERRRQDEKWGEQNHPDGTSRIRYERSAEMRKQSCQARAADGSVSWTDVFLEEVYEALAETDSRPLREELVQCAAVIINWIGSIDRRAR